MDRPTCATCPFFAPCEHCGSDGTTDGVCRRMPPGSPLLFGKREFNKVPGVGYVPTESRYEPCAVWPHPDASDWCGEHPDFPAYLASLRPGVVAGERLSPGDLVGIDADGKARRYPPQKPEPPDARQAAGP